MSNSYTRTETFTITNAKYLASKVATDLMRFRRFYDKPSFELIAAYEAEITALLKEDYLDNVIYGFKRDGKFVEALRYHALPGGILVDDDDPGKIRPGVDVSNAEFSSYLYKNSRWTNLTQAEKDSFEANLPFIRTFADEPPLESGAWARDHNYLSAGRALQRSHIIH